jgi:8-oxo-dGTP pyrophosphatase MutT (NUDIX family)
MNLQTHLRHFDLSWASPSEKLHVASFYALLRTEPHCFYRTNLPAHFTGSAIIATGDFREVLLTHHRKLGKWLQLGGHADGEPNLFQVALREGLEESGLPSLSPAPANNLLDIDIHRIPERPNEPAHFHYDARYVFLAESPEQISISSESLDLRWFGLDDAFDFVTEESLRRILRKVRCLRDGSPDKIPAC